MQTWATQVDCKPLVLSGWLTVEVTHYVRFYWVLLAGCLGALLKSARIYRKGKSKQRDEEIVYSHKMLCAVLTTLVEMLHNKDTLPPP